MLWSVCLQVQYLVSRWGTDPNSLGCYAHDVVGKPEDSYERLLEPLENLFFGGEAVSLDHQGSVHGAYSAGIMAAENCQRYILERRGNLEKLQLVSLRSAIHEAAVPLQISRMWNIYIQQLEKKEKKEQVLSFNSVFLTCMLRWYCGKPFFHSLAAQSSSVKFGVSKRCSYSYLTLWLAQLSLVFYVPLFAAIYVSI